MNPAYYIARRLRLNAPDSRRSAMSIRMSIVGVALSVAVMLLTIAIVTGFKHQITSKVEGFDAQISIEVAADLLDDASPIVVSEGLSDAIARAVPHASVSSTLRRPAMLKTDDAFSAVVFRAYDDGHDWSFLREITVDGSVDDFLADDNAIAISSTTASRLKLDVGDKINTCFVVDSKMRLRNFSIAAIFDSNFNDYDRTVAFASPKTLRRIAHLNENQCDALEISGVSTADIPALASELQGELYRAYYSGDVDEVYTVSTVLQSGNAYFTWLSLLDMNVVVIIAIMAVISIFTLIASLFVLILERVNLIGTLKTIGAPDGMVRKVFIVLASRIMLWGLLWGNVVALAVIIIQGATHVLPLDPEAYFISFVPVSISAWQVVALNASAIVVGLAVMILPTMIVSRMRPSQTIRFE